MGSGGSQPSGADWLVENGPRELELLFRAIVYHPSAPLLIADDDGNSRDASAGAAKLLGLPREKIIGHQLDDFASPGFKPQVSQLWRAFLEHGEQEGTLQLVGPDGIPREVEYTAKGNVLPVRHAVVLRDKTASAAAASRQYSVMGAGLRALLLDIEGRVVAWYSGAARIFGYQADEVIGQHVSFLHPGDDTLQVSLQAEFKRAADEGHTGTEGWQDRKDGSRFWANAITLALKDGNGELQGFARVVRDFSDRHERDEKLQRSRARIRPIPLQSTIAGVVSGEFDCVPEMNDTFLELVGYTPRGSARRPAVLARSHSAGVRSTG